MAKADKPDKASKGYNDWLANLPEQTHQLLAERVLARDAQATEFNEWLGSLSSEAVGKLAEIQHPELTVETAADTPQANPRYGVVVCESGEFPIVKLFRTAESMAAYVGTLEGQDICVVCFHGQFLPITTGPPRFVVLGDQVVSVPCQGVKEPVVSGAGRVLDDFEQQVDGFLGPVELSQTDNFEMTTHEKRADSDDSGVESPAG